MSLTGRDGSTPFSRMRKPRKAGLSHFHCGMRRAGRASLIYSRNSARVVSTPKAFVLHPTPKQLLP